jgi:uncharacterized membrane protein
LSAGWTTAQDINEAGQIVGDGVNAANQWRGIIWEGAVVTELAALSSPSPASRAFAISDAGQVVGASYAPDTDAQPAGDHAVRWTLSASPYHFSGFLQPVDNPGLAAPFVVNRAKAGSAIPVKFSLGGDRGLRIFADGYPKAVSYDCSSTATLDAIEQTLADASSSLKYDAATDQYTYVWKTDKALAGKCRKLVLGLSDGSPHYALFNFAR